MQELEAKFLTAAGTSPAAAVRRLQESLAWAGFRVEPQGRREVSDTYFDTPDHRLRLAGWSYRRRSDVDGSRIALKEINRARAAVFDRQEIEQPVTDDQDMRRPPPGPVQERLSNLLHPDAQLEALFTVENRRAAYRLSHPDHPRGLVEMAWDNARVLTNERLEFTELELELKEGPHELLASVLAAADLEPGLVDARLSKYERGLLAAGCPVEPRRAPSAGHLHRKSRWLDVAVVHLKSQLLELKAYEPHAWEGLHPEGVHQMRVATRRARAALTAFADVLPRQQAEQLAPGLRWLARRLGEVRDLDVHLRHVGSYRELLPAYRHGSLLQYQAHLEALRRHAHGKLLDALGSPGYQRVLQDYHALLNTALRPEHACEQRVEDVARPAVLPLLRRLVRRGGKIDAASEPERLHKLRIDAKRLRYQLEALTPAYDGALQEAEAALRKLQDRLGRHQDAEVARLRLAHYRRTLAAGKSARKTFRLLIEVEQRRGRRQRKLFPPTWQRFEGVIARLEHAL